MASRFYAIPRRLNNQAQSVRTTWRRSRASSKVPIRTLLSQIIYIYIYACVLRACIKFIIVINNGLTLTTGDTQKFVRLSGNHALLFLWIIISVNQYRPVKTTNNDICSCALSTFNGVISKDKILSFNRVEVEILLNSLGDCKMVNVTGTDNAINPCNLRVHSPTLVTTNDFNGYRINPVRFKRSENRGISDCARGRLRMKLRRVAK